MTVSGGGGAGAHLEPALACADSCTNILCDKPLEITVERADRMISVRLSCSP